MGALTAAMAAAAKQAGAEIRTNADVQKILVKNGAVIGVALASGEEIAAKCVVSGADPRRTLLGLLDPIHLPPSFVVKMQHFRAQGTAAKLNLALDGLPTFTALKQSPPIALRSAAASTSARASTTSSALSTPPNTANFRPRPISIFRFPQFSIPRSRPQASTSCPSTCSSLRSN